MLSKGATDSCIFLTTDPFSRPIHPKHKQPLRDLRHGGTNIAVASAFFFIGGVGTSLRSQDDSYNPFCRKEVTR